MKISEKKAKTGKPGHVAIMASAGSGKTTRLAHRYIGLLADPDRQVVPGRICAMTFTRKAAGEIFDRIAENLSKAASDKAVAKKMAEEDLQMPTLKSADFLRLLRLFLDSIHRTSIGTMDSFIVRVAKLFPLELGIPVDFQVADAEGALAMENRQGILMRILSKPDVKPAAQKEFLEAFKKATFGHEEKAFGDLLENLISSFHLHYRLCASADKWGNENLIWPGKGRPWKYSAGGLEKHTAAAGKWIEEKLKSADGNYAKVLENLRNIVEVLGTYGPTTPWADEFETTVGKRLITNVLESGPRDLSIEYQRNSYGIDPEAAGAMAHLVGNMMAVEIDRALRRTIGMHALLEHYDRAYDEATRQSGRFSFTDIQYLLARGDRSGMGSKISRLSGEEGKLYIDYRMDSKLDHWLLDEFQDTSDLQWAIFSNLISELIQASPDGYERSFFYVGDVKQAIYRWRGGNPNLFREIYEEFNKNRTVIDLQHIAKTHRCSQPVVDAVNKVFSALPASLPAGTAGKWKTVWKNHETYNKDAPGYVALLEPPHTDENRDNQEESRYRLVADLLNEVQPVKRRLEVGILVRTNYAGSELANALRRDCPGMSFVHEGKAGITRNELVQALLSLVAVAAHPGDEFAWKHVQMTPLLALLETKGISRKNIAVNLLREVTDCGFQSFIDNWGAQLESTVNIGEYGRECLSRLENAAAEFDATGSRDCSSFLDFINEYEIHEEAMRTSVRIMTIHQAKGLEFDMVILPELQSRAGMNMVDSGTPDLIHAGKQSNPDWILRAPRSMVCDHDATLKAQLASVNEDACFDYLCLLYVAMTRAKHALYIVTSHQGKSEVVRPARFIKEQLTGEMEPEAQPNTRINRSEYIRLYSSSEAGEKWFEARWPIEKSVTAPAAKTVRGKDYSKCKSMRKMLKRSEPSKQEQYERKASSMFDPESHDVLGFGSVIHKLFEQVEWVDKETDPDKIAKSVNISSCCSASVYDDACVQFRQALRSPEVRKALTKPAGNVELWREKGFDIVVDGEWISGIFDRVIIARNATGRATDAVILDYKSNRIEDEAGDIRRTAESYRRQMELYRLALSGILGLPQGRIAIQLLLTRIHKIYTFDSL